jgi:DNA polymerase-3 subunit gamma/tau
MELSAAAKLNLTDQERRSDPYQVLARKYRPKILADLVGQVILVKTLTNGITTGRLPHAFIFTGVRGIGKTSTARILARSLNCIGADGNGKETAAPCGYCEHCFAISEDRHIDVIEMDAASRTGVDDIREVIEAARYKAISARYKIYIIDEVHMLSKSAFNALLKTLEEPPPHVKFIFATTEIQRVPQTIISRCMRFTLRRAEQKDLEKLLAKIADQEKAPFEELALSLIAHTASGSMRDGISLLDQAITLGNGYIKVDSVRDMLGLLEKSKTLDLLKHILAGEASLALQQISEFYTSGADPIAILQELLDLIHWITLLKISPDLTGDLKKDRAEREAALELAHKTSIPILTRMWQILVKGSGEASLSSSTLHACQMVIVRLCYVSDLPTPEDIGKALLLSSNDPSPYSQANISSNNAPTTIKKSSYEKELPKTFADLTNMVAEKGEPILHAHIIHDIRLIDYQPGALKIELGINAPPDLSMRFKAFFDKCTGYNWLVTDEQPDLKEQQQEAINRPLAKAALDSFPGATIESVSKERISS